MSSNGLRLFVPTVGTQSDKTMNPTQGAAAFLARRAHTLAGLIGRRGNGIVDEGFLDAVRARCFARYSDRELREEFEGLGARVEGPDGREAVASVFALVAEAIGRRLGAWRLFDAEFDAAGLADYRRVADEVLEARPFAADVAYYTDDAYLDSPRFFEMIDAYLESPQFSESVDAWPDKKALDGDGRTIVRTLVYVSEKSAVDYWSNILLPAEFYRAVAAKDVSGALTFRPSEEQLSAGRLLYGGKIVEMNAGEGKTVAAAFPAALHALAGRSVHIITANDYLASRDAEWLAPVYESLGLSVGAVLGHMSEPERADAYRRQIVYGTLREFGFDFLRDNLKYGHDGRVQGPLDVAIVDEADHALIDEAATPLIIAGAGSADGASVHRVRSVVERLVAVQRELVRDSEAGVLRSDRTGKERTDLLARLLLADPDSRVLSRHLSADRRFGRHVRARADALTCDDIDDGLTEELCYIVGSRSEFVTLTERGQRHVEEHLGAIFDAGDLERQIELAESNEDMALQERRNLSQTLRRRLLGQHGQMNQVYQTLRAYTLLKRDTDYIVDGDEVVLIDRSTGRRKPDNRYQHGLQSALEAKESVAVRGEPEVLAQVSVPGLVKQYSHLAGITGTALSSTDEFRRIYGHDVVAVRPTRPSMRADLPTRLYASRQDKLAAVVDEVRFWKSVGRPVLVGTLTVEQSEELGRLLNGQDIDHRVLDAVNNADEAQIVRSAGSFGATTVATNMAGRGTDVVLDLDLNQRILGRYAEMVRGLHARGAGRVELTCGTSEEAALLQATLKSAPGVEASIARADAQAGVVVATPRDSGVGQGSVRLEFGLGLHVVGTEMNESSRIDLQLRGRCARQGEFGSSRFMLSLEDRPLVHFAGGRRPRAADGTRDAAGGEFFEGESVTRLLEQVQEGIETTDEANRARTLDYTRVIEHLTLSYYRARNDVIDAESLGVLRAQLMEGRARRLVAEHFDLGAPDRYDSQFDAMAEELWVDYRVDCGHLWGMGAEALHQEVRSLLLFRVERRVAETSQRSIERAVFLQASDEVWREYIAEAQDMMLSTQISGWSHRSAVADYALQSVETYRRFMESVADAFVLRVLQLEPTTAQSPMAVEASAVEDIEAILV